MRRYILSVLLTLITSAVSFADTQADFDRHVKAYNSQIASRQYLPAAHSAAVASALCGDIKNYEGGFKFLTNFEKVMSDRGVTADSIPSPYYYTAKARYDLYTRMGNKTQTETWLRRMGEYARKANNKDITSDMLFNEAKYYYSVGADEQGDRCIARLIKQFETSNDYKAADKAYRDLIQKAVSVNDAVLVDHTYEQYNKWSDSIEAAQEATELGKAKAEVAEADTIIANKEHTIMARTSLMTVFIALFVISLGCLGVTAVFYRRILGKNRHMKKAVENANRLTAEKSAMMQNMSSSMEPALDKLDPDNPAVREIRDYMKKVEEYSAVEAAPGTPGEGVQQVNLETFLNSIAAKYRPQLKRGATLTVEGARGSAMINTEEVRKILEQLTENAVKFTPEGGRVTLTYKKRSATTCQFIVQDTGSGIPEDERETLFKAFNTSRDISEGDGLGLPICAMRAEKIGGSLTIDPTSRGACFILTLH